MDHPGLPQAHLRAGGGQRAPRHPLLLSDQAGRQVHRPPPGARLHLREDHEAEQGGSERGGPVLHLHGLPLLPHPLRGSETGKPKYYGRFNQGVVTINLVDVALSSGGDMREVLEDLRRAAGAVLPGADVPPRAAEGHPVRRGPHPVAVRRLARLKKGEPIDKLLYGGYSTISLGYAGLYECVKYMTGKSHTDPEATPFALEVMEHMNGHLPHGRPRATSTSPSTARRWSPPPTSSPSACKSASASSRASPTRATSPTATTSM